MEVLLEKYEIRTSKIRKKIKIAYLSDLHYMNSMKEEYNKSIINKLIEMAPNYIVLGGDYFCGNGQFNFNEPKSMECLKDLLKKLKILAPVILTLGNHDLSISYDLELRKLFKDLEENDLYPLDNESIEFDDIRFTSFYPTRESYAISYISDKKLKMIVEDWNKYNLTTNKKYNVLCHHLPDTILDERIQEQLKSIYDFDLILSGHAHNGWLSPKQEELRIKKLNDKIAKTRSRKEKAILEEKKYSGFCESILNKPMFMRKYCRGIHEVNGTKLIISRGITCGMKYALGNKLLINTNKKYAYITEIDLVTH